MHFYKIVFGNVQYILEASGSTFTKILKNIIFELPKLRFPLVLQNVSLLTEVIPL